MVKHPNESRFEFALRLTKALKDAEAQVLLLDDRELVYLDSKAILDVLYDEIMNPVDPLADEIAPPPYAMEEEFNEFSPSVMEEAAPKVDQSFVDALKERLATCYFPDEVDSGYAQQWAEEL
jgi:hypothetical protein